MRLLYITNGICGPGGLERVLSLKASYLTDHLGYEVHILTLNEPRVEPFYKFSDKIFFYNLIADGNSIKFIILYVKGLRGIVNTIQPDIISVCDDGIKGFFVPLLLKKKIPIIYERHASADLNFKNREKFGVKRLQYFLICHLIHNFAAFVVLTKGNAKEWKSKNVKVIPNPLSFFPPESSPLENSKVIAVGSHNYNKGFDLLLKAWKIVSEEKPEWTLQIVGKSDVEKRIIQFSCSLGLSKCVIFKEPLSDIQGEYLNSSIMVLSSRSEGFGMVLIEAMACGLPSVAFDCPSGPADIITNGLDGLLVKNGDIMGLADALLLLIEDQKIRQQIGSAAKESARRYLIGNVIPMWEDLFKEIANESSV